MKSSVARARDWVEYDGSSLYAFLIGEIDQLPLSFTPSNGAGVASEAAPASHEPHAPLCCARTRQCRRA